MRHVVDDIIEGSGLSKASLSTRSGIARSTLYRIREGRVDPGVGSVRELALAAGFDLALTLKPLSDPDAARAARVILDPIFAATFEVSQPHPGAVSWVERLHRWVPSGDPVEICRTAGQSSSLVNRENALFLRGPVTELKLASAGDFSKQDWFLSGLSVMDRIGDPGSVASNTTAPYVVYSNDPGRFERLLDHMERVRPEKATVIIAERTDGIGIDSWTEGKIKLVAPIQGLIDSFGIGGSLAASAEKIARSW